MINTLPPRIKPKKTYPVGKAAREGLSQYLYNIQNYDAWMLIASDEYRDYDWTDLMEASEQYWINYNKNL